MGAQPSGPSPHFHRGLTEFFYVRFGTARGREDWTEFYLRHGTSWVDRE